MALTDENKVNDNIIDINIDPIRKTRFRINQDNNSIIELNLSDMGIIDRLETGLDKLKADMSEIAAMNSDDDNLTEKLKEVDARMCDTLDYIFDYPVSKICAKGGTMYDLYNGMFRYEHIIDSLSKLYTNNLNEEYKKLRKRIEKYTDKYTNHKPTQSKRKKS